MIYNPNNNLMPKPPAQAGGMALKTIESTEPRVQQLSMAISGNGYGSRKGSAGAGLRAIYAGRKVISYVRFFCFIIPSLCSGTNNGFN